MIKFDMESLLKNLHYAKKRLTAQPFSAEEIQLRANIAQQAADIISQDSDVIEITEFGSSKRKKGRPGWSDIDLGVKIANEHPTIFNPRLKYEAQLRDHGISTDKEIPMHVSLEVFTSDTHLIVKKGWQRQLLKDIAKGKKLFSRTSSRK